MKEKSELEIAEEIARKAHENQFRRDGKTPYIQHVLWVAGCFFENEGESKLKCVAWLHDVLEDNSNYTPETLLEAGISQEVVDGVVAITKQQWENYSDYLIKVKSNNLALEVKIMDIIHNQSDDPTPEQDEKYIQALRFLLLNRFKQNKNHEI